jgi:hypothetical protein
MNGAKAQRLKGVTEEEKLTQRRSGESQSCTEKKKIDLR